MSEATHYNNCTHINMYIPFIMYMENNVHSTLAMNGRMKESKHGEQLYYSKFCKCTIQCTGLESKKTASIYTCRLENFKVSKTYAK